MKCKICGAVYDDDNLYFCIGCGAMLKNPVTGGIVKDSGFTIGTSVPEKAVFTDTVTEVVDNLTSIDSDKALSANQGKILNETKAPLESPTFSGVPTAPTAGNNINSSQVATTAFVKNNLDNFLQVSSDKPINGAKLWFKVLS